MRSCRRRCSSQRTSCVGTSDVRVAPRLVDQSPRAAPDRSGRRARRSRRRTDATSGSPARSATAAARSGTRRRLRSRSRWMVFAATVMRLRCRSITALGAPVVPPLKFSVARSSPSPSGQRLLGRLSPAAPRSRARARRRRRRPIAAFRPRPSAPRPCRQTTRCVTSARAPARRSSAASSRRVSRGSIGTRTKPAAMVP